MKAHSGWAAVVTLGRRGDQLLVVDRRRLELVEPNEASWAKQPYHAAERLKAAEARERVRRGLESANRVAFREVRLAAKRAEDEGLKVAGCAVLVVDPMPGWTVDEILAVHFRMHKAEGVMFREALALAVERCGLRLSRIHEKKLDEQAERALATPAAGLRERIESLGKAVGPPWGKDQKDAALAAMIALAGK